MDGLYWETWYNNKSLDEKDLGYIYYENKRLGVPRLRQIRVHSNSCVVHDDFTPFIKECFEPYSESIEDTNPFGLQDNDIAYVILLIFYYYCGNIYFRLVYVY